jgi:pyrroloquinoline quinone biosynthesis protein B
LGFLGLGYSTSIKSHNNQPVVIVLGITQDGGFPQAGCRKSCCKSAWKNFELRRFVSCLAIVDPVSQQRWIVDATADFKEQLRLLDRLFPINQSPGISGIFLTHGHMGHYTGLMHLGREAMGTHDIPVYAMLRMYKFLSNNGPWDQLITLKNISLQLMKADLPIKLNEQISITPIEVPHRDEYSETVGFVIKGPSRSILYISDIDKWDRWDRLVENYISKVDIAFLDATFYDNNEIPNRDMSEISHPFIIESMDHFQYLDPSEKLKIHFIHFNHTNPVLIENSDAQLNIKNNGFNIAEQGQIIEF